MKKAIKFHLSILSPAVLLGALVLALFSALSVFFFFQKSSSQLLSQEESLSLLERRAEMLLQRHRKHNAYLEDFSLADPNYVSRRLEQMRFLQEEGAALEALLAHGAFANSEGIASRLQLVQGSENRLKFAESARRRKGSFEEVELAQMHPVEMSLLDLKTFLYSVEHARGDRPQLIIKDFTLEKEKTFSSKEIYKITSNLLQREIK